ncbi:MAG: hypothetical protein FIA99_01200 [Ruminiclostridium sp.]|nr:hypothetical protein [Ruminiclostridium sp.]
MSEQLTLNTICLTGVASTITDIMGIAAPKFAAKSINEISQLADKYFHGEKADRVLIYNPDAIALWLFQKYTSFFDGIFRHTQIGLPILSVMPSVTPVCFASMYTGAMPEVHGIKTYEKPVVRTDTLFDALIRAGKKPAIVSTANDSISQIFLERTMNYFIFDTPDECNQKALELIEQDEYDLIVVYNGNYDAAMHCFSPEGAESLEVLKQNISMFDTIAIATRKAWEKHNTLISFLTDHGCHEIDGKLGSHGLDMPEDMNIIHFYGFQPKL